MNIYCYRSGHIGFASVGVPDGALTIRFDATDEEADTVRSRARRAYDGKTFLVPGIPEAEDDAAAYQAFANFVDFLGFAPNRSKSRRRGKS